MSKTGGANQQVAAQDAPLAQDDAEAKQTETGCGDDPEVELRIIILGYDAKKKKDKAIGGRDWKFTTPVEEQGQTGGDGLIKVKIKKSDASGKLEVSLRDPPGPATADAAVVNAPEDYPIKIKADDWKDTDAEDVLPPRSDDKVKWALNIVDLDSIDNDEGVKGRLHSLAFPCDSGAGANETKTAVQAYQLLYEKKRDGSGKLGDVEADVKKRHDKA